MILFFFVYSSIVAIITIVNPAATYGSVEYSSSVEFDVTIRVADEDVDVLVEVVDDVVVFVGL